MTRGHKGTVPDVVPWKRAADYWGISIFDLLARDDARWWQAEALSLMRIEAEVEEAQAKIRARQGRR